MGAQPQHNSRAGAEEEDGVEAGLLAANKVPEAAEDEDEKSGISPLPACLPSNCAASTHEIKTARSRQKLHAWLGSYSELPK